MKRTSPKRRASLRHRSEPLRVAVQLPGRWIEGKKANQTLHIEGAKDKIHFGDYTISVDAFAQAVLALVAANPEAWKNANSRVMESRARARSAPSR